MGGDVRIVKALVESGANLNVEDFDRNTPLHYASELGRIDAILYLLNEAKCDPNPINKFGQRPYDIAQDIKVREIFDKMGEAVDSKNAYGRTAFHN